MAYTDSFTYTNGELSSKNATWVKVMGSDINVSSNQIVFADNSLHTCYLYNQTFASAHYAKLKVLTSSSRYLGPAIRAQETDSCYRAYCGVTDHASYPGEQIDGSDADWSTEDPLTAGDVAELWVDESTTTTIYYKVNGSTIETYTSKSGLTGGKAGIAGYEVDAVLGDDWEGGDVAASTPEVSESESVTVSESKTITVQTSDVNKSEAITATDTPTTSVQVTPSISDAVTVTDTPIAATQAPDVNVTDSITVTDTPTVSAEGLSTLEASASEAISISDTPTAETQAPNASATETVTVADTPTLAVQTSDISVTDSITVTDTPAVSTTVILTINVSDTVYVIEPDFFGWPILETTTSEAITVTDTPTLAVGTAEINASEAITVTDTPEASVQEAGALAMSVSDNVTVGEDVDLSFEELPALGISITPDSVFAVGIRIY